MAPMTRRMTSDCKDSAITGLKLSGQDATCADLKPYCNHPSLGKNIKNVCPESCGSPCDTTNHCAKDVACFAGEYACEQCCATGISRIGTPCFDDAVYTRQRCCYDADGDATSAATAVPLVTNPPTSALAVNTRTPTFPTAAPFSPSKPTATPISPFPTMATAAPLLAPMAVPDSGSPPVSAAPATSTQAPTSKSQPSPSPGNTPVPVTGDFEKRFPASVIVEQPCAGSEDEVVITKWELAGIILGCFLAGCLCMLGTGLALRSRRGAAESSDQPPATFWTDSLKPQQPLRLLQAPQIAAREQTRPTYQPQTASDSDVVLHTGKEHVAE
jgi:hypothetical protein